jgi:hypothetical protein
MTRNASDAVPAQSGLRRTRRIRRRSELSSSAHPRRHAADPDRTAPHSQHGAAQTQHSQHGAAQPSAPGRTAHARHQQRLARGSAWVDTSGQEGWVGGGGGGCLHLLSTIQAHAQVDGEVLDHLPKASTRGSTQRRGSAAVYTSALAHVGMGGQACPRLQALLESHQDSHAPLHLETQRAFSSNAINLGKGWAGRGGSGPESSGRSGHDGGAGTSPSASITTHSLGSPSATAMRAWARSGLLSWSRDHEKGATRSIASSRSWHLGPPAVSCVPTRTWGAQRGISIRRRFD